MTKNHHLTIINATARCRSYGAPTVNNSITRHSGPKELLPNVVVPLRAFTVFRRNPVLGTSGRDSRQVHLNNLCGSYSTLAKCFAPSSNKASASAATMSCIDATTTNSTNSGKDSTTSQEAFSDVCIRANKLTSLADPFVAEHRRLGTTIVASSKASLPPTKSAMVAEHAADSLLAITSSPKFLHAVSELYPHQEHPGCKEQHTCLLSSERLRLHVSFLKVTHWCLVAVSAATDDLSQKAASKLVQKAMDLAIRGEKLGLPPHIPLYNQLAAACGVHLGASSVLKVANSLQRMLFPSTTSENQPHIFDNCIRAMIHLGKYEQVLTLLRGMKEDHDLYIGRDFAIELTERIQYHRLHGMFNEEHMLAFSAVLIESANSNISQQYQELKQDLSATLASAGVSDAEMSNVNTLLDDIYRDKCLVSLEEDACYEDDDDSYDSDGTLVDALESIDDLWDDDNDVTMISSSAKDVVTAALAARPLHDAIVDTDSSSSHSLYNVPFEDAPRLSSTTQHLEQQRQKMIYVRDTSWVLPDIVDSILETTGKTEILYSKEYEEEIIRQLEEDSDVEDDDEFYNDVFDEEDDDDDDDDDESF